jgi:hypothetical protein
LILTGVYVAQIRHTAFVVSFVRRLSTPDLYRLVVACLVVLGLGAGVAGLVTERCRSSRMADIVDVSGPLSVVAQDLYRSLSDADATAASAFLANGVEPAALRQRYLDDIARASSGVTVALRDADDENAKRLGVIGDQLSVYTGLVETARSYNRLGVPLGGAYLREASGLMRQTLLPAAQELFESAQGRLVKAQRDAEGFPWTVVLLGLVTLGSLVAAQVLVSRRTNRTWNLGLVAASLVAVLMLAWSSSALNVAGDRVETGNRDGSAVSSLLAGAHRAALQARADEALTLIARGSGAVYEQDFKAVSTSLDEQLGRAMAAAPAGDRKVIEDARAYAQRWRGLHVKMRQTEDDGDYLGAVRLATETGPETLTEAFGRLDTAMTGALATTNGRVDRQAGHASTAVTGLAAGLIVCTLGLLAAVVLGFRPRIGEYR